MANLHATYINSHLKPGTPALKVEKLLPFLDPWKALAMSKRYSELDREIMEAFAQ